LCCGTDQFLAGAGKKKRGTQKKGEGLTATRMRERDDEKEEKTRHRREKKRGEKSPRKHEEYIDLAFVGGKVGGRRGLDRRTVKEESIGGGVEGRRGWGMKEGGG